MNVFIGYIYEDFLDCGTEVDDRNPEGCIMHNQQPQLILQEASSLHLIKQTDL